MALNQPKHFVSIEKAAEDKMYANVDTKGVKFEANLHKTKYTFGEYQIATISGDMFGYKYELFLGTKTLGSFYKLINAKKHVAECINTGN